MRPSFHEITQPRNVKYIRLDTVSRKFEQFSELPTHATGHVRMARTSCMHCPLTARFDLADDPSVRAKYPRDICGKPDAGERYTLCQEPHDLIALDDGDPLHLVHDDIPVEDRDNTCFHQC